MKKFSLLFVAALVLSAASAYAAEYTCTYADHIVKGSGDLTVSWDGGKQIDVKGNYSFDEGNDGKLVAQTPVSCSGNRRLPETKAAYFKKWAVYDLDQRDHNCQEDSVRVSKNADGEPVMKSIVLVNYKGDTHDSSGWQSFYFTCESKK